MTEAERTTLTRMLTPLGAHYLSEIRNDLWVAYNNNGFCGPYCTERMFTHLSRMAAVRDLEAFHKVRTGTANLRYTDIEQYEIDIIDSDEPSVHYYCTVEKIARWNIAKGGGSMPQIPKYVENLLLRRKKLASSLMDVCCELDQYCKRIGVETGDADTCTCGHVMIYTEPSVAYRLTKGAIEERLGVRQSDGEP